jgi:hypothetical protein
MSNEQLQNELFYHQSIKILQRMLERGLISKDEYRRIDLMNRESFKPALAAVMP